MGFIYAGQGHTNIQKDNRLRLRPVQAQIASGFAPGGGEAQQRSYR